MELKPKCSNCEYTYKIFSRRAERPRIYCEHPEAKKLPLYSFGYSDARFICFGDMIHGNVTIKTCPKWCPRKQIDKEA